MRQFDFLALIGVIAFTSSGFFINSADARGLAEVTLEKSPFGPNWKPHTPAEALDNVHEDIDFGNLPDFADHSNDTEDNAPQGNNTDDGEDDDKKDHKCTFCQIRDEDKDDEAEDEDEDEAEDEDQEDDDIVESGNPNDDEEEEEKDFEILAGGEGDENPFLHL